MAIVEIIRNTVEVLDVLRVPPKSVEVYLRRGDKGERGERGLQGIQGEQGLSGVVAVNAPLTNSGTSSSANLSLTIDGNLEVAAGALKVTDTLNGIDKVAFDVAAGQTAGVGQLVWNDTDGTLDLGLKGGNVTLQVGQELNQLVKHADNIGLGNGKVVYLTGSDGNNITVRYARGDTEATSSKSFAVMTEDAVGGAKGFATTFGLVRNIDTSHLTEGGIVWLSPTVDGGLTTTKPVAPYHSVFIGLCVRSHHNNGILFVNISNGYELNELHSVSITNPTNGQVLVYEDGLWINSSAVSVTSTIYDDLPAFYLTFENGLV